MKNFAKRIISLTLVLLYTLQSCSSSGDSTDDAALLTPSNLSISATVVGATTANPNGDGSGIVNFKISANNATSYKILVDGKTVEQTTTDYSHTFTTSGTNTYVIYVSAYNGTNFISSSTTVAVTVASKLVWSEEFNVDGAPNSAIWGYDLGDGNGWGNNESQYYTSRPENIIVQNGVLKIKTIKESYMGSSYTSARLKSQGKFSFKYGKIEFRAKLPEGKGTWPALWMLGDNIGTVGWPACGEIDVMEHVGNSLNKIHGSLHSPGRFGNTPDTATTLIENATTEFHIYSADWTANYIKFYVDNKLFYTFTNSSSFPFNQNFFLILNTAIGGNFGGAIDPNFTSSTFEIDYIRIFN
ncbi:glycoside hydrolase family 16 protein [Flavobacterium sp. NG2]|uniref:glycoside hydrolase family 16 protein n=1 Tax=Flavobacterium sp. NG2 TaxID=3097547 RepID=UPI002A7EAAF6|nr:glycoside hydrolase family 16 protein [Flavobacterium sp. NG2]WPR72652.1 glycoside hydrolase family 16 protein [Flavobacterium sp. NG2]